MAIRRRRQRPQASHERWLVSYADFITLLFAFFTAMYAISTVDAQKLEAMVASVQDAFASGDLPAGHADKRGAGALPRRIDLPVRPPSTGTERGAQPGAGSLAGKEQGRRAATAQELKAQLDRTLVDQVEEGLVDIEIDPRGLVVSIREAGSFATASADLSPVAVRLLEHVATTLTTVSNPVRIEGHTDDVPIHTDRYRSNWELSTARATSVVALLLERGLDPPRLSAAGYAEHHPRVANDSAGTRARNRRIDLVVLDAAAARHEPATSPAPPGAPRN